MSNAICGDMFTAFPKPAIRCCRTLHLAALILAFALCSPAQSIGDNDPAQAASRVSSQKILTGHFAGRLKLKTGVFRATGRLQHSTPGGAVTSGPVEIFCAFDFPAGKLRFDRTEPRRNVAVPDADVEPRELAQHLQGGQYARTPEAVTVQPLNHNIISVLPPERRPPGWARAFDIRTVGLAHQHDLDWETPFSRVVSVYEQQPAQPISEEESGLVRIDWMVRSPNSDTPSFFRSVWFDPVKDNWPVRFQLRSFAGFLPAAAPNGERHSRWSEIIQTQEIDLVRIQDQWVPGSITMTSRSGQKRENV